MTEDSGMTGIEGGGDDIGPQSSVPQSRMIALQSRVLGRRSSRAHLFKPGQPSANPAGRPKGTKHRLAESLLGELIRDFEAYGVEAIVKTRLERPWDYLKIMASCLPKEVNVTARLEIADSELDGRLEALSRALGMKTIEASAD